MKSPTSSPRHACIKNEEPDLLILGGGLAGGLIALALAEKRPDLDVRIIEASEMLGGNHVWSFFDGDVAAADKWLVAPLICHHWDAHEVRFPAFTRTIAQGYNSITSERLDAHVRAVLPPERIMRGEVADASPTHVTLADGRTMTAQHVIDARGAGDLNALGLGWQKFVGQVLEVRGGHGLSHPIIMDATVDQSDGYRFVYCLPFSATEVFVEDTYYTNGPELDVAALAARIAAYAVKQGWAVSATARTEMGVLPVVIGGDFNAYWASTGADMPKAGVRGGLFQPLTSYSLPDAVRLAAAMPTMIKSDNLAAALHTRARTHWRRGSYYRLLAKMLFRAAAPNDRYRIFERFYKLSPALIARFYAGQSHTRDKLRILTGKPPVPLFRALRVLLRGKDI